MTPPGRAPIPLRERFARFVMPVPDGCHLWTGSIGGKPNVPYGRIGTGSVTDGTAIMAYAHRVAHELFIGPIPAGYVVDHLCSVSLCVNPGHLEAVTARENYRRSQALRRDR